LPTNPEHAIYVWFDALINYLTGVGFGQDAKSRMFASRWPANVHVIGKDIVRFHAIYWPAMLMSAGLELPRQIAVHGWVSFAGEELTQSGGHVVTPSQVIDRYGSDVLRYFLLREVAFDRDGDFTWEAIARRYQDDLGNDLGNLVLRSTSMLERYEDGIVPEIGKVTEVETSLQAMEQTAWEVTATNFENWRFHQALAATWKYINGVNRYIEQTEPWKLAREDSERHRLRTVLATVLDALPRISTMIRPVMPQTADNIDGQLGISGNPASWGASSSAFSAGHKVPGGAALFPRLDG
jgi:methionyl-tRNA synthetase